MLRINIEIRPSRQFITFTFLTLFFCLFICWSLPFSYWVRMSLTILIFLYGGDQLFRHGWLLYHRSIIKINYDKKNWQLQDKKEIFSAELCGESTVTPWVCILRFIIPGKRFKRTCILFKDIMPPDEFRRLLVILRQ